MSELNEGRIKAAKKAEKETPVYCFACHQFTGEFAPPSDKAHNETPCDGCAKTNESPAEFEARLHDVMERHTKAYEKEKLSGHLGEENLDICPNCGESVEDDDCRCVRTRCCDSPICVCGGEVWPNQPAQWDERQTRQYLHDHDIEEDEI